MACETSRTRARSSCARNKRYARRQLIWFRKEPIYDGFTDWATIPPPSPPSKTRCSPFRPRHRHRPRQRRCRRASRRRGGDEGSNTLGNIARQKQLHIPTLRSLALRVVHLRDVEPIAEPLGGTGRMAEASAVKDSVTGHWELMESFSTAPSRCFRRVFPPTLIAEFERRIGRSTIGNVVASGTAIIEELGAEHVRTGSPIVYTSADSVFQIAAHEEVIPVPALPPSAKRPISSRRSIEESAGDRAAVRRWPGRLSAHVEPEGFCPPAFRRHCSID